MIVLGHRGGRGDGWPAENSLEAFQRALDEGADGVELDVRMSADGALVLHHDARLRDRRRVAKTKRADLAELATLEDALDVLRGRFVNVEIKADDVDRVRLVRAVGRAVARAAPATEVLVSSFDPFVVAASAAFMAGSPGQRVRRGMLVGRRTPQVAVALPLAMRRIVRYANLEDPLVNVSRVERLSARGLSVLAWTVNDVERARAIAAMGVETIITDRPRAIVDALNPRR